MTQQTNRRVFLKKSTEVAAATAADDQLGSGAYSSGGR